MAYSADNAPRLIVEGGFTQGKGGVYVYKSSHASSDYTTTGFFAGAGFGSRNHSAGNVGMRVGDLVLCAQTTDGPTPGYVTVHTVIASTIDQASTTASTGFNAAYNITLSAATTA